MITAGPPKSFSHLPISLLAALPSNPELVRRPMPVSNMIFRGSYKPGSPLALANEESSGSGSGSGSVSGVLAVFGVELSALLKGVLSGVLAAVLKLLPLARVLPPALFFSHWSKLHSASDMARGFTTLPSSPRMSLFAATRSSTSSRQLGRSPSIKASSAAGQGLLWSQL